MKGKVKENILAIAIAIILVLFIGYGINVIYAPPERTDYCKEEYKDIQTKEGCEQEGGKWTYYQEDGVKPVEGNRTGWCNQFYECEKEYDAVRDIYERNVFIISLVIGIIAIIVGGVVLASESVGAGILGGGVLIAIYGTLRYWGDMSKYIRIIILGIVLFVLIWIGYKKIEKNIKKK